MFLRNVAIALSLSVMLASCGSESQDAELRNSESIESQRFEEEKEDVSVEKNCNIIGERIKNEKEITAYEFYDSFDYGLRYYGSHEAFLQEDPAEVLENGDTEFKGVLAKGNRCYVSFSSKKDPKKVVIFRSTVGYGMYVKPSEIFLKGFELAVNDILKTKKEKTHRKEVFEHFGKSESSTVEE